MSVAAALALPAAFVVMDAVERRAAPTSTLT
jgi:hypothetical protein